ncbi:MAG: DHH family phosphoesterase [Nanoarchaeota archaeon]
MQDFEKHKRNFFNFLDSLKDEEMVGIVSHANCLDGMTSAIFMVEILKKKYPIIKADINFISYTTGALDKLAERFNKIEIKRVFVLDLNVDMEMIDEFEKFRKNFNVCFIDHHPVNLKLIMDENVIKTDGHDCTGLVIYRFGEGIIDYSKWTWLACVTAISEFSYKGDENLKFIQKHYPDFDAKNVENSEIFNVVNKTSSLVIYYSKDSLKAYDILLKKDFEVIDNIHSEVSSEMERCLQDFEKNAERHFDNHLYFYLFKSRFSMGSKMSTILSVRHRGSTIITFSEINGTDRLKVSVRNNADKLIYFMNEMLGYGVKGLENAMGAGHPNASGGSFMKKDLDRFKKNIIEFVKTKLSTEKT